MNRTVGFILAGGAGSRLGALAGSRAKPAVPFGGIYRIIDFTLSNARNSGLNYLGVLTQYKPLSLMAHLGDGRSWDYAGRCRTLRVLPPQTGEKDSDWYHGTADAIRQNLAFLDEHDHCDTVLILSGDHIYHMDYARLVEFHRARRAHLTIATLRVAPEDASRFGIATTDRDSRIIGWEEKPDSPKSDLASMGIYVFSARFLRQAFAMSDGVDFGKDIVPLACHIGKTYAYPFEGYWRDVGTVRAYWEANLDLLRAPATLDPEAWKTYTHLREENRLADRPSTYIGRHARVRHSVISPGCTVEGEVVNSVLSPGVWVHPGASVRDAVILHGCEIGPGARVHRAILDKEASVSDGAAVCGDGSGGTGNIALVARNSGVHATSGRVRVVDAAGTMVNTSAVSAS